MRSPTSCSGGASCGPSRGPACACACEGGRPAHEGVVAEPEAPGPIHPRLRVVDAHARPGGDAPRRHRGASLDPDPVAEQVGPVEAAIDPQRDAELARAAGETVERTGA